MSRKSGAIPVNIEWAIMVLGLLACVTIARKVALASHPDWLLDTIKSDWPADWQEIVTANNQRPPMWLRPEQHHLLAMEWILRPMG